MELLANLIATVINVTLVAFGVRRLLGVPVGWPRTLLVSLSFSSFASWLFPSLEGFLGLNLDPGSPNLIPGVLLFTLVFAWLLAAQVGLLAAFEAFVPTGSVPGPVAFLRSLPARRRRSVRYTKIVAIAASHGLSTYLRPRSSRTGRPASKVARSLREALTDGGVTFVKLGQMLASRPDLLPPAYIEELAQLQTNVPAQPWSAVKNVFAAELGRSSDDVFSEISEEPIAAASVAQIHLARLSTGEEVVVKIQRPDARRQVTADLDIVLRLASWLGRITDWGRTLGIRPLAEGFAASLEEELDYRIEVGNMRAIAEGLAGSGRTRLLVPRVHEELCSSRVLVMDLLPGLPVVEAADVLSEFSASERAAMAEDLLGAVLHQIIVTGVFHADLHPGNILVADDGTLGLLDFGAVGRLDRQTRTAVGLVLAAVDRQDSIAATDALLDLLDRGEKLDDRGLERDVGHLILKHASGGTASGSAGMFVELFAMVMAHGLAVPPQVAAAFRALGALEGSLNLISPGANLVELTRSQGRGLISDKLSVQEVRSQLEGQLAILVPILQRFPRRINKITEDLEAGRFTIGIRALADPLDRAFLTGIVHQLVMTLIGAACALGGILLIAADSGPMLTESFRLYAFFGFTLLFFGFVLAARVLVQVFHQGGPTRNRS